MIEFYKQSLISSLYGFGSDDTHAATSYELITAWPTKYDDDDDPLPKRADTVVTYKDKVGADWALGAAVHDYECGEGAEGANKPFLRIIHTVTWNKDLPPKKVYLMGVTYEAKEVTKPDTVKAALFADTVLDYPKEKTKKF